MVKVLIEMEPREAMAFCNDIKSWSSSRWCRQQITLPLRHQIHTSSIGSTLIPIGYCTKKPISEKYDCNYSAVLSAAFAYMTGLAFQSSRWIQISRLPAILFHALLPNPQIKRCRGNQISESLSKRMKA